MTQTLILSNIIHLTLEFLKKSLLKLNPLLPKHVYVYHLNFFMLHLVKHILMVIRVKNSLINISPFLFYPSFTFMVLYFLP